MKWFGPDKFARACDECERVPMPIGEACLWCKEPIGENDCGYVIPNAEIVELVPGIPMGGISVERPHHVECLVRSFIGSVGHQMRQCSCFGIADLSEDGLSKREAARRSEDFMRRQA